MSPSASAPGLALVLERQAARLGGREFLRLRDARLSYADADEVANRAADVLARLGVAEGQIVMARCGNDLAMVATWFACMRLGAVFMPVNRLLQGEPLRRVMAHARARVLVCDADLWPQVAAVASRLPDLGPVLVAGGPAPAPTLSFDTALEGASAAPPPPVPDDPAAPAKLAYTSGTTGTPKGVVWSRACEATWAHCYAGELLELRPDENAYCCLPLHHVTCQGTTLGTLVAGGRITVDDGFAAFGFWDRVRAAEAHVFTFVGSILATLARMPERADDADNPVRRVMGSATPADRFREIERRFGLEVMEVWGQTETASCWTMPATLPQEPGTVGRPTSRFEAVVVDERGREQPPGRPGELWIRPSAAHVMFEGYLGDDGGVRPAWDDEGWYHTGDLMTRRGGGDLAFLGRRRDAIRWRGEMIAATDVEIAALAHPAVLHAAAVGVPDDQEVEDEVKLCVVLRPERRLDEPTLHRFLAERLPRFMVPRYLQIRAELPTTSTARVQKYRLREEGSAGCWDARRR